MLILKKNPCKPTIGFIANNVCIYYCEGIKETQPQC